MTLTTIVKKEKIFLYLYILVVVIKVGLLYPVRQSSYEMIAMTEKFEDIKNDTEKFKTFDDSLAGNPNFRKRLLDSVSTAKELRHLRQGQRDELINKIGKFRTQYFDRERMIKKFKILDGLNNLVSIIIACMAIPIIIYVFKRR